MKERHWTNLVSSLRHGQCVLILGPEVPVRSVGESNGVDSHSFADVLKIKLTEELQEEGYQVTAGTLAGVGQQYEDAEGFGPSALRAQAARIYSRTPEKQSFAHDILARLPFSLIVSTCHDRLMENALRQGGKEPISYHYNLRGDRHDNPEFVIPGLPNTPVVYHLFGDFEDPQSLVVSENDLLDFLIAMVADRPPMPNCLRRALQHSGISLLFVGFGIQHWYLRVLLKALVRSLSLGRSGSAVALEPLLRDIPDFDRQQTILFYQRGTRIEVCADSMDDFLTELQRRFDAEGGILERPQAMGSRPRVFVSYASDDSVLATRLYALLQQAGFEPWLDKETLRGGQDWNLIIEDQLRESDYVLVLQTPSLSHKRVGYVNKEIAIAREQAQHYRGSYLIPVIVDELPRDLTIEELEAYQSVPLRKEHFNQDIAALFSTMRREYQRRQR